MLERFLSIILMAAGILQVLPAFAGDPALQKIDPYFEEHAEFQEATEVADVQIGAKALAIGRGASSLSVNSIKHVSLTPAFIKSTDPKATAAAVTSAGGQVRVIVDQVMSVSLSASAVKSIAARPEVDYIEAGKPLSFSDSVALGEINADQVRAGQGLPQSYTGEKVIIGIVDTGIDLSHPDFNDENGKSRVVAVWDQRASNGTGPKELINTYGTECLEETIQHGACLMRDTQGHGTHIAGTAAGRNEEYGGVAPDAKIIAVNYRSELEIEDGYARPLFSTTICEACYYVFKKAEALGMPAVCNLSLGTHIGAHDGTSLFEQCLDGLTPSGVSGRVIVAAAGNENPTEEAFTGIHVGIDANAQQQASNFVIRNTNAGRFFYLDLWGQPGTNISIGLALHSGLPSQNTLIEKSEMIAPGAAKTGAFQKGLIAYQINAEETSNPNNGKPHIGISIMLDESIHDPSIYSFDLIVQGSGHVDGWFYPDKPATTVNFTNVVGDRGQRWSYVPGDRKMSIAMPATAVNVIAVGAYATRNQWDRGGGCCKVDYAVGRLLPFSSIGPTVAPERLGVKPEIVAPGAMVAAALSRDANVNELMIMSDRAHAMQAGTSMAAPFVSGTAALLFSANPSFTRDDIERYLREGAYSDEQVGQVPSDAWGYGKLDVLATINAALTGGASGVVSNANLTPPQTGSEDSHAGCTLTVHASPDGGTFFFIFLAFGSLMLSRKCYH